MEEKQQNIEGIREGESTLDYRIRTTKNDLKLDNLFATVPYKTGENIRHFEEFGFGFSRGPMIRRGVWLLSKLSVLYIIKGYRRLKNSGKQA